ncbi:MULTISPECIES: anthranilate synthase component I family protein [unclassified Myroides]|uniref:anthranilate synthase component I family protein n=1 Tax=unclassified Myroides TaxID=2642485 RepID=UPI0031014204
MNITTHYQKLLGDTYTPVELYLKLRDKFPNSLLLESSDYNSKENSYSYICLTPIASICVEKQFTHINLIDVSKQYPTNSIDVIQELNAFTQSINLKKPTELNFINNGLFGYTSYNSIPLLQEITIDSNDFELPLMQYAFYKNLIVFNHFKNELYLIDHTIEEEENNIEQLKSLINNNAISSFPFQTKGEEKTMLSNDEFLSTIKKGKEHCQNGDVFQLVLSRKFNQEFQGDEFNVYRTLRSINPSPYLFFFDYGDFKIFGSSPEAQLVIKENKAYIHPIAGTFQRSGDPLDDKHIAEQLLNDPKESAEHVMLVDLARNDLSKNSEIVQVEKFKQVEYYSHVIHLVSKVSGTLANNANPIQIFADTFPAGTLSGAPKHKAMQLINQYEPESRGFYGGAVGIIGLDGTLNQAIFIRSVLSHNNHLTYQAGCGIVIQSNENLELQEIDNKLRAVRSAIQQAENI